MPDLSDKVSDIAPCPFDHEQRVLGLSIVPIAELNAPRWHVRCMDCGAHGPRTGTRNSALAAWNARTRPASSMEGWRLVPEKSTDEMHKAYTKAKYEGPKPVLIPDLWVAMLAASPIPPEVMK